MTESSLTHMEPIHKRLVKSGTCGVVLADMESKVHPMNLAAFFRLIFLID